MIGRFPWDPFPPGEPTPTGDDPLLAAIYRGAVEGADAYRAVRSAVRRDAGVLRIGNRFVPDGRYREVAFVALGHAAGSMALAALDVFGDRLTQGFLAAPKKPSSVVPFRSEIVEDGWGGAEVVPRVLEAAREIAASLRESDLLLLLLSPGAVRALLLPPAGVDREGFATLLQGLHAAGSHAVEVTEVARVLGQGGVGGRLFPGRLAADVQCLIVERGEGARAVGGGPTFPISEEERVRARETLERTDALARLPSSALAGLDAARPAPLPTERRPVVIAAPADGLRAAGDVAFDKGWAGRVGMLGLNGDPASSAEQFVARAEEIVAGAHLEGPHRPKGIAVFATTTLDVPEGVDERAACEEFLAHARGTVRRREMSIGLLRTAGAVSPGGDFAGGVVGAPGETTSTASAGLVRPIRMPPGITDVGLVAVALVPGTASPRPRSARSHPARPS